MYGGRGVRSNDLWQRDEQGLAWCGVRFRPEWKLWRPRRLRGSAQSRHNHALRSAPGARPRSRRGGVAPADRSRAASASPAPGRWPAGRCPRPGRRGSEHRVAVTGGPLLPGGAVPAAGLPNRAASSSVAHRSHGPVRALGLNHNLSHRVRPRGPAMLRFAGSTPERRRGRRGRPPAQGPAAALLAPSRSAARVKSTSMS